MCGFSSLVILTFGIALFPEINGEQNVFKKPEIHSLHIHSDVKYRFSTTTVSSRIKNVDTQLREAKFDVTLPNEAFITNLTLEIDGKIINGEIKEKEVAKKQYEAAQQRGESAGYIGTIQRETNKFNLAVTVAPQSKVSLNLTYQELLKRTRGHYEQVIYIDPGQPVSDMDITVAILESREITDLRVPPLRNDVMANLEDLSTVTVITTPTPKTAFVKFLPSIEFQTAQSASGMAGQFVVQYDVERAMDIGDVLVVNGYFVHFFAPEGFRPIPNDVLFILDISGSMTGTKLRQLKQAMKSILGQLNEGDRMNIMTFSGSTSFWKTEMVDVLDEDTQEEAKRHIDSLTAGGWTDINTALTVGVTFLKDRRNIDGSIRSPVVVFLTDGEATHGVTNKEQILKNLRASNNEGIPIFSLAFGKYADYELVKKISIQNDAFGRKIYEASDASMQIAGFYNEISVTLLHNLTFQYLDSPVSNVTKHEYANYFNGSEIVTSGRLENIDNFDISEALTIRLTSNSVDGPDMVLTGDLRNIMIDSGIIDNVTSDKTFEMITEKVWAYLTIKQLLDKEFASSDNGEKQEYKRQILELSLKYGFVTPLTSMVVTLPENEDIKVKTGVHAEEGRKKQNQGRQFSSGMFQSPMSIPRRAMMSRPLPQFSPHGRQYSQASGMFQSPVSSPGRARPVKMSRWGYRPASADLSADYDNSFADPFAGKFGSGHSEKQIKQRKRQKNKKKKNNKKKNNRNNKKSKGFQFPLRVKFPKLTDPLCFNMYDNVLETAPETYLLFRDNDTGLQIDVMLEKTLLGKWTKQGSIKEIHLTSGEHHFKLTRDSFEAKNVSTDDGLPWNVSFEPSGNTSGPTTEIKINLDVFHMTVTANKDGYLSLVVEGSTKIITADTGIINQVLTKKVKVKKIVTKAGRLNKKGKKKPDKEKAILNVDGVRFAIKRRKIDSQGSGVENCWQLNKHEAKLLNTAVARIT